MIIRRFAGSGCSTAGATAVEFGLRRRSLLPAIFGIFEFGRALWDHNALQQTAIAAARCEGISQGSLASTAACNGTTATAYAQQVATTWGMTVPTSGVTVSANTTCGGVSGFSQVSLTYTFTTAVPAMLGMLNSLPLTATACFPVQP